MGIYGPKMAKKGHFWPPGPLVNAGKTRKKCDLHAPFGFLKSHPHKFLLEFDTRKGLCPRQGVETEVVLRGGAQNGPFWAFLGVFRPGVQGALPAGFYPFSIDLYIPSYGQDEIKSPIHQSYIKNTSFTYILLDLLLAFMSVNSSLL